MDVALGYSNGKTKLFQAISNEFYQEVKDMMGTHKNKIINNFNIEGLHIWYISIKLPKKKWKLVCNYKNKRFFSKRERKSKSLFDFAKK